MLTLLHRAAQDREGMAFKALRERAIRLLDAFQSTRHPDEATEPKIPADDAGQLADPLSERELEVLRLLDSTLTGPEISRRLYVSLNTFRTHTKRIFTKLDVNNRAAAVHRGRELDLL
jgi:LuxR family maltose regulon positive regulatory protein